MRVPHHYDPKATRRAATEAVSPTPTHAGGSAPGEFVPVRRTPEPGRRAPIPNRRRAGPRASLRRAVTSRDGSHDLTHGRARAERADDDILSRMNGDAVAGLSLLDHHVVANPFVPTREAVALLRLRAAHLSRAPTHRKLRRAFVCDPPGDQTRDRSGRSAMDSSASHSPERNARSGRDRVTTKPADLIASVEKWTGTVAIEER